MLQARSVMNLQSQLGYCTDIAIFTSHSEGLLAFAMSMRLKLSASSVVGAPRRSNKKSGLHIPFESAISFDERDVMRASRQRSLGLSNDARMTKPAAEFSAYVLDCCAKPRSYNSRDPGEVDGGQVSPVWLGSSSLRV